MTLNVIKPGILSLIQDAGRQHYQHLGLTTGGAADEQAFFWANRLLDNLPDSPAIEMCFGGLQLKAQAPCQIAITGADCNAMINDQPVTNWQTHHLNSGDSMRFAYPRSGVRSYLAVKGGFNVPSVFGSVASVMREKTGGLDGAGSALKAGDSLPVTLSEISLQRQVPQAYIPDYDVPLTLRVIERQQSGWFTAKQLKKFYAGRFQITTKSNQMAIFLNGSAIKPNCAGIISEAMPYGAIQIPPTGQLIVLLKDRQTIGGYPVIGSVLPLDAFLLAQQPPGKVINFTPIALAPAQQLVHDFYQFFRPH